MGLCENTTSNVVCGLIEMKNTLKYADALVFTVTFIIKLP